MRKYDNVQVCESPFGIMSNMIENTKKNKYLFWNFIDMKLKNPNKDFFLHGVGKYLALAVTSVKAYEEFLKLVPTKVDRFEHPPMYFFKLAPKGIANTKTSNVNWKRRRTAATKLLGLNKSSQYIPMMVSHLDNEISKWEKEDRNIPDLAPKISSIAYKIISTIFFGKDGLEQIENVEYTDPYTYKVETVTFPKFLQKVVVDASSEISTLKMNFFPILSVYNL